MKSGLRYGKLAGVMLAGAILGACSTPFWGPSVTYSYEPRFGFPAAQTYRWAEARPTYRHDPLLEANVRYLADRALEAKGLASRADKTDLLVWIGYDVDSSSQRHELRALTLNISRADSNALVWRGTATGTIRTDADSSDLKSAVEKMLATFPPK